jgi:flagellar hook assembly protein FlgD
MNRFVFSLIAAGMLMQTAMSQSTEGATEKAGAHWARLSDRAQIDFAVDALHSAAAGKANEAVVRKSVVAPGGSIALRKPAAGSAAHVPRTSVTLSGTSAVADGIALEKRSGSWYVTSGTVGAGVLQKPPLTQAMTTGEVTAGETFIPTPISREYGIDRLSRSVTQSRISRTLFGTPEKVASYYTAHYMDRAPFVRSTYIQFVTDPAWNRIVYGNLDRWIRQYDGVNGPSALAVSPDGRVFVGETGNTRVTVLQIVDDGGDATLQRSFVIEGIQSPTDIALSDNGTPLDPTDDVLYVADASRNCILRYVLGPASATLVATFEGFDSPTSIATGRWNGAANGLLYVIDHIGKRVRVFDDDGTALHVLDEVQGTYAQYFKSLKTDHFGNVYLVDNVNSQVLKYTSSLELLDVHGGQEAFTALAALDIPFGCITVDGQGAYWAGFDQLFAVERWSDGSGAQRRILGLKMKEIGFATDDDVSTVQNSFTLTDFGKVIARVYNSEGGIVRTISDSWMISGRKEIAWDRRDDGGALVPPGTYRYELQGTPAYRDEPVISQTQLSLPLYYYEDCGSTTATDDAHLVRGSSVRWGSAPSQTAEEDPSSVVYTFPTLDPAGTYEVAAEYVGNDARPRLQDLSAGGIRLHGSVSVSTTPTLTGYIAIPREAYANGTLTLAINARGEAPAIVSQLWLRETGRGFRTEPVENPIPTSYALNQNYPNPFNPTTTIRYAVPAEGNVSLRVYDVTGKEVATLVNGHVNAGTYDIRFDARNSKGTVLASGVYFYQLRSGSFTATKKFILLR